MLVVPTKEEGQPLPLGLRHTCAPGTGVPCSFCTNTVVELVSPQSGRTSEVELPDMSCLFVPLASTTYKLADDALGSRSENTMRWPSGDHDAARLMLPTAEVTSVSPPPIEPIFQRSKWLPLLSYFEKAMLAPSGDHAGSKAFSPDVIETGVPPVAFMMYM